MCSTDPRIHGPRGSLCAALLGACVSSCELVVEGEPVCVCAATGALGWMDGRTRGRRQRRVQGPLQQGGDWEHAREREKNTHTHTEPCALKERREGGKTIVLSHLLLSLPSPITHCLHLVLPLPLPSPLVTRDSCSPSPHLQHRCVHNLPPRTRTQLVNAIF